MGSALAPLQAAAALGTPFGLCAPTGSFHSCRAYTPAMLDFMHCFVLQVVIVDERFELMLIFWSTMAVFQANFGATIKKSLTDQIDQIRKYVHAVLCEFAIF